MIDLIPFKQSHLDLFVACDEDIERYGDLIQKMDTDLPDAGFTFTAVADGRVLVVGGVVPYTMHTGYGWTFVSKYAEQYGISVFRVVKQQLEAMMRHLKLHRVETANLLDAERHRRWCRLLGFEEEGVLRKYDEEGRDYIRMAKIMEKKQWG